MFVISFEFLALLALIRSLLLNTYEIFTAIAICYGNC